MGQDANNAPPPDKGGNRGEKALGAKPDASGGQQPAGQPAKPLGKDPGAANPSAAKGAGASAAKAVGKGGLSAASMKGSVKGTGASMAGDAAGAVAGKVVAGDGSNKLRAGAGRYASAAAKGATQGAMKGGAHGAAVGAAVGTGMELGKDAKKDLTAGESSKIGRVSAMSSAASVAPAAGALGSIIFFVKWLKQLALQMAAFAANLGNLIWSLIVAGAKWVAGVVAAPFLAVGGFVANTFAAVTGGVASVGVSITSTVVSAVTTVAIVVGVIASGGGGGNPVMREGFLPNTGSMVCGPVPAFLNDGEESDSPPSVKMEESAKKVFSILKHWGTPNENIAGVLGNWSHESGIDSTSVETILDEPYSVGPRKQAAWDAAWDIDAVDPAYGAKFPRINEMGVGLGQWTNGRNTLLMDYADSKSRPWHAIETQLAFMIEGDNPSDVSEMKEMIAESKGTPGEAAMWFMHQWEGISNSSEGARQAAADQWFGLISGWEIDQELVGSVDEIVGDVLGEGGEAISHLAGGGACENSTGFAGGLTEGGMTEEEAASMMALYIEEGDAYLDDYFGVGAGPGTCQRGEYAGRHGVNCVSFSWYFLTKYTSYDGGYARGHGIETANSMSSVTGIETTDVPTPYSIFSTTAGVPEGHTGVVLRVEEDRFMIGEAGYCRTPGDVRWIQMSDLDSQPYTFLPLESIIGDDLGEDEA